MQKFHFLVRFTKLGRARFLSHRELMILWEQAVRRADIPIAFSEGFNPKPRISFPTALALGIESEDEVIILHLTGWLKPDAIRQRLSEQLIEGITITNLEPVSTNQIAIRFETTYKITLNNSHSNVLPAPTIIKNLIDQKELFITRSPAQSEKKVINIRPYLKEVTIRDNAIILVTQVTPQGTMRPEEIIPLLGLSGSMAQGDFAIRKIATRLTENYAIDG